MLMLLLTSCVTSVSFNIEHPPLVDLRNAKTITVIPFEWSSSNRFSFFAQDVTAALVHAARRGSLSYVDPSALRHTSSLELYKYVDVYITGRIINILSSDNVQTREDRSNRSYNNNPYNRNHSRDGRRGRDGGGHRGRDQADIILTTTRVVTVEIEYTYIRASTNRTIGNFKKSASASAVIEQTRTSHRQSTGYTSISNRYDIMTDTLIASAIRQFSSLMSRELGLWTSTEKKTFKGGTGSERSVLTEAKKMIRQQYYGRAYELYSDTYEHTGSIRAGYNLALLLQFDSKYSEALELLEGLRLNIIESGNRVPAYITKEIHKLTGYVDEYLMLEDYKE